MLRFLSFINENTHYDDNEVNIVLKYLQDNYPVLTFNDTILNNKPIKYVTIDQKTYFIEGIPNKTHTRRVLFNYIKEQFPSFKDGSINKAIKIHLT